MARVSELGAGLTRVDRKGLVLGVRPFEGRGTRLGARMVGLKCSGRYHESLERGTLGLATAVFQPTSVARGARPNDCFAAFADGDVAILNARFGPHSSHPRGSDNSDSHGQFEVTPTLLPSQYVCDTWMSVYLKRQLELPTQSIRQLSACQVAAPRPPIAHGTHDGYQRACPYETPSRLLFRFALGAMPNHLL